MKVKIIDLDSNIMDGWSHFPDCPRVNDIIYVCHRYWKVKEVLWIADESYVEISVRNTKIVEVTPSQVEAAKTLLAHGVTDPAIVQIAQAK